MTGFSGDRAATTNESACAGELAALGRSSGVQLSIERGSELPGDRTRFSGSNRTTVQLDDGRDVARRAGHEQLVEATDLRLQDRCLADVEALLDRELEHDVARDAGKDVVRPRIRAHLTVDDAEDVRVRPLGDDAVANEHRLERAGGNSLLLREHGAEEVDRLEVTARPADVGVRHGGCTLLTLGAVRRERRRGQEDRRGGAGGREVAGPRRLAARDLE